MRAAEDGAEEASEALRVAMKRIDKAAAKGIIHKNQASNRKSRLMKRLADDLELTPPSSINRRPLGASGPSCASASEETVASDASCSEVPMAIRIWPGVMIVSGGGFVVKRPAVSRSASTSAPVRSRR